jgi:AbiTii
MSRRSPSCIARMNPAGARLPVYSRAMRHDGLLPTLPACPNSVGLRRPQAIPLSKGDEVREIVTTCKASCFVEKQINPIGESLKYRAANMQLLDQIVDGATGNTKPLANLLRRCLVLSSTLKNEKLKAWAHNELNGYDEPDTLPPYRKIRIIAHGTFLGSFGRQLNDQPLPPGVMKDEHRDWATIANLSQPIAAYEGYDDKRGRVQIPWPASLIVLYQNKFFPHQELILNRAWQEIPISSIAALLDTVRNRILGFALELREQLGTAGDKAESLEAAKVDRSVVNIIYGGNNVIASTAATIQQAGRDLISEGDTPALMKALADLGMAQEDAEKIIHALTEDGSQEKPSLGQRTLGAIKTAAGKLVSSGKEITVSTATSIITHMVIQYLGGSSIAI